MEYDIKDISTSSNLFQKKKFQKQLDIIKKASEVAQEKIDYYTAHDDHILHAIEIVEGFLRKKHRICYGGQAINAHLPLKYKFYDPEHSIPDYDFFTPSQEKDITMIVNDLKKAGFTEISAREGMHEGTVKIYVDYIPVADITEIDPALYKMLSTREYRMDGISYLDANSLRMLMYLELSRPRGELSRWGKVYERLMLFNEFATGKACHKSNKTRNVLKGKLTKEQVHTILAFIIEEKRIFAGADLLGFYEDALKDKKQETHWIISSKKPIVFFSDEPENDAKKLVVQLHDSPILIKSYKSKGIDIIPTITVLTQSKQLVAIIVHQSACHSYLNVSYDHKLIRIASMDTLITLYFGLGLLHSPFFDMGSMECLAHEIVQISIKARAQSDQFIFPFISIKCVGHQTTLPSLIRAKVTRITEKKQQLKKILDKKRNTVRKNKYMNFY